jgi:anti-sigma B factor antagonist
MGVAVTSRTESLVLVVELSGEIDPATTGKLRAELRETVATAGSQVVLDLGQVSFMDSTGLHLLLEVKSWCEEAGGSLRLTSVHGEPGRVLDICGFDQLMDIERLVQASPQPASELGAAAAS